jgi:hypothetical protein
MRSQVGFVLLNRTFVLLVPLVMRSLGFGSALPRARQQPILKVIEGSDLWYLIWLKATDEGLERFVSHQG